MNRITRSTTALTALAAALLLASGPAAAAEPQPAPTRLVQISLLAATKTGPNQLSDLPANARKAIDDIQQFLPFKSYRLLDTALVRTSRSARTMLRGPNNGEFRVSLAFAENLWNGKLQVLRFELVEHQNELVAARDRARAGDPSAPAIAPRAPSGPVITTSFSAEIGQTVVVGSSRLDGGDEALIVLFTALP